MVKIDLDDDRYFFEHANLKQKDTGEPFDVWFDEMGKLRNVQHNEPRFKFKSNGIELDIILHSDDTLEVVNPIRDIKKFKHLKKAEEFIRKFEKPLRMHWNQDLTSLELMYIIRSVCKNNEELLDVLSRVASGDF